MAQSAAPSLRLVFMGTADFAVPALEALAASRHRIALVYTQPPRPAGRGMQPRPSPVAQAAARLGLPVRRPHTLRDPDEQAAFAGLEVDLGVVAAYGMILPEAILDAPRLGCINLHASLLPRWRGAAPIQHALLAGDEQTGVTVMQMAPGLDTGPILAMQSVPIEAGDTAGDLHDRLADLAARMVVPAVDDLAAGRARAVPQADEGVTYAGKLDRAVGRLDWQRPAAELERRIRALSPWPGCWTEFRGERLKVLAAEVVAGEGEPGLVLDERLTVACGTGALRLARVQRAGGRPLAAEEVLRGFAIPPGSRLGGPCRATS